mmetsp:Transcript_23657/g.37090  ORF Transcript_23657/g.37090 Transcript_23657/m.37090 type:complete len:329 (+) Transcript_23657:79-1065(+)
MKTLIRIALLLGSLGLTSGATFVTPRGIEFAPVDGCTYGLQQSECPVRMECFKDENMPKGGRCDCNPLWFKVPAPLPFDDSEWDDGFTTNDCKNHHFARFIAGMFHFSGFLMTAAFIYTDVAVLRELKRSKALKWNATAYSLVFMLISASSLLCVDLMYMMDTWDADKTEFWYHNRRVLFVYVFMPFNVIIDFEIGVTWIDLYDRTNKMSKSSSYIIKSLRWILRIIAFILSFGFLLFVMTGGMMNLLVSALAPSVIGFFFVAIAGYLITKTLCPNKKDTANPNWKVASAISRGVKHTMGAKVLEIIALLGMGLTGKHPVLGYTYGFF